MVEYYLNEKKLLSRTILTKIIRSKIDMDTTDKKILKIIQDDGKATLSEISEKLLKLLKKYFPKYKPDYWLFENQQGNQFSKRTIQRVFQNAVKESGVLKKATLTILKNSYIVHLLEKGVDIRFIQKLLGHKNVKTTSKYLKVSKREIEKINSPLDDLDI